MTRRLPLLWMGLGIAGGLATASIAHAQRSESNCITCHQSIDEESLQHPALAMAEDVHASAGLTCADCHGGDPTLEIVDGDYDPAKAPGTGFVGAPSVDEIPTFCAKCHADAAFMRRFDPNLPVDQLAQYQTSGHGRMLDEGARDVAQCVSCHGAHGVLPVSDPRAPVYPTKMAATCGGCHADPEHMEPYDLPTDQLEEYGASVHAAALYEGGDLSAPTCNTCHGNHGAAPPGIDSVSLICGNCHAIQQDLFAQSPHREAYEEIGEAQCETCHGNHAVTKTTDEMLGAEDDGVCGYCHFEGEEPYEVAQTLRRDIEDLKSELAEAAAVVERASVAGMEVSDAELTLIDAHQSLVKGRNAIHAVSPELLAEHTDEGRDLASGAMAMGVAALEELDFRRKGLGVSVFFILLAVVGLYLKIRQIER